MKLSVLCTSVISLLLIYIQGTLSVDYNKLLAGLYKAGLVSDRVKRSIHSSPAFTGLRSGGCPIAKRSTHTITKRSPYNHQAAEGVLAVITDLSTEYGYTNALKRIKRSVDFRQLDCQDGWAPCEATDKYRHIDGRCNNLANPTWGAGLIPHLRYTRSAYSDGVGAPRLYGVNGSCLPTPRQVSKTVHMNSTEHMKMSVKHSHMLMLWGQFLDHDITLTPQRETLTSCCTYEGVWRDSNITGKCVPRSNSSRMRQMFSGRSALRRPANTERSQSDDICMALEVDDDTFGVGHTCFDFQRSLAVPSNQCQLGKREQINEATAFIDGSQIYGSDDTLAWELRLQRDGLLNTSGHNMLPPEDSSSQQLYSECVTNQTEYCFKAGDSRVNVQPGLSSIHTLFMNEHNRIAQELMRQLPAHISTGSATEIDEFVYQETRRIVGAVLQHITYNEFLPILLGNRNMYRYGLSNNRQRRRKVQYNSRHQPSIRNEFATFAFRVGHSLVPEGVMPLDSSYSKHGSMQQFDELLMSPHLVHQYGMGDILRGVISEPAKQPSADITHHLENAFKHSPKTIGGMDLVAVNIQRGRDHGIPSYTVLRRQCRLSVPTTFEELEMAQEVKDNLAQVYQSVEDIDAWTGAVSEQRVPGAMVGSLNACIIGRQFRSLRQGDRFWYEFQQPNVAFSNGQLDEIYKSTLARVLCDNLNMNSIQPQVFYLVQWNRLLNRRIACSEIPSLDLTDWFSK